MRRFRFRALLPVAIAAAAAALAQVAGARGEDARAPAAPAASAAPDAERVRRLAREVEALRGKTFKQEVAVERQTAQEFRKFVEAQIEKELPPAEAARQSKALHALGLLPRDYDLRKGLADLYVSQAGAYYNPETKTFYLLVASLPEPLMDDVIRHELVHALQDQYHDLAPALERARASQDDDVASAFQHLVEGEAQYVLLRRQLEAMGVKLDRNHPMGDLVCQQARDLPRDALIASVRQAAAALGPEGAELRKAMEALEGVPDYLFWALHSPYVKGQFAVHKAHAAGGWEAVDALYARPPRSTEQVLHPEKLIAEPRDEPAPIPAAAPHADALGEGWQLLRSNTLGELGLAVLLERWGAPRERARAAAAGWDGDRYHVYEGPGGALALLWYTTWDSVEDAGEFDAALKALARPSLHETRVYTKGPNAIVIDAPATAHERILQRAEGSVR